MKLLCALLMLSLGMILFFWMMIQGWGLSVQNWFPIVVYYIWHFVAIIISVTVLKASD